MMNTKNLVRIDVELNNDNGVDRYLTIRAHNSVKSDNPFKCDNIKLNGEPIEGRDFKLTIFDSLTDSETGLTYKFSVGGYNEADDLIFPQVLTFDKDNVQISEVLALSTNLREMSLKPSASYLNRIFGNFGQHIFFQLMENYVDSSIYELRSVKERYPFDFIPIVTNKERIFTETGYTMIETYHNGHTVEYSDKGMRLISKPTYIISIEHPYSKLNIEGGYYTYEPEPIKFRELTVDTSKSMYEPAKVLEEITKDMISF